MSRMPVAFFGHGSPMNALQRTRHTEAWAAYGTALPAPSVILVVSAHWYVPGTKLTAGPAPRTVHDFGRWAPRELFEVVYPAPGSDALAERVRELLDPVPVANDASWGLDHGAWSVLVHAFPEARIPVVQLSIDRSKAAQFHYDLGTRLAPLRDEGVFVMTSGNVVHNLEIFGRAADPANDWASRFERHVRDLVIAHDHAPLIDYKRSGADGALSIPTPDHYLPLLYAIAQQREDDPVSVITEGVGGALSMLSIAIG
jgi:4,5-DOPA dioxygenase extradiol